MKLIMRLLTVILLLFVSGCSNQNGTTIYVAKNPTPAYEQTEDNIIVRSNGKIENFDRFETFFHNVQEGNDDQIRVVKYTTEGAPILYDYDFTNNQINVEIDTTRDGYGTQEIFQTTCSSIIVNETNGRTDYVLEGCTPAIYETILTIE